MHALARKAATWVGLAILATSIGAPVGVWYAKAHAPVFEEGIELVAPALLSPGDGSRTALQVKLDWEPVFGAAYYRIQISGSPEFLDGATASDTPSKSEYEQAEPYAPGIRHYWRVQAVDEWLAGGPWSPTRTFTPDPTALGE